MDADWHDDLVIGADGLSSGTGAALLIYGGVAIASSWNWIEVCHPLRDDVGEHRSARRASWNPDSDGKADFLVGVPFTRKRPRMVA